MSPNENDFFNSDLSDGGEGGYVPGFERELQNAGGNVSAPAKKKAAENADSIDMEIDVSSLRSSFEEDNAETADESSEIEIEVADEYGGSESDETETLADEADIDFIYDEDYQYTGSLEDISVESIALDSIDVKLEEMRTDKSSMISSLKNQMQADDLAMSVENRPKLDEMSDEYFPSHRKSEDIMSKEQLDKDEKELIKNRLKTEMEKKPENFDKKKSLAMYKKLMDEQKAKAAKRGFIMLLITTALGFASAVLIYLAKPNASGDQPLLDYLPVGAIIFALFMMVKSKFAKIMSTLFFTACTVMLIYPGLFSYAFNTENQLAKNYVIQLIIYVAAIAMCAVTFIRLLTNKDIEEYYSYKPSSGNRRGR
ncbi:MAG: hypothetical protein K2G87_08150 [Oscillospiraceae bacterium]|nr:hypothetical protein [Oscillospiraceae bacterium]